MINDEFVNLDIILLEKCKTLLWGEPELTM